MKKLVLLLVLLLNGKAMGQEEVNVLNFLDEYTDKEEPRYEDFIWVSSFPPDITRNLKWKYKYKEVYYPHLMVFFVVSKDGKKYGLVDKENKQIIPLEYDEMDRFVYPDKIIWAKKDNKWGALDYKGTLVIPFEYDDIIKPYRTNLYAVKRHNKWGYIDKNNDVKIAFLYDEVTPFYKSIQTSSNYAKVKKGERWGIVNRKGEEIVHCEYKYIKDIAYSDTFFTVYLDNKSIQIDFNGNVIATLEDKK